MILSEYFFYMWIETWNLPGQNGKGHIFFPTEAIACNSPSHVSHFWKDRLSQCRPLRGTPSTSWTSYLSPNCRSAWRSAVAGHYACVGSCHFRDKKGLFQVVPKCSALTHGNEAHSDSSVPPQLARYVRQPVRAKLGLDEKARICVQCLALAEEGLEPQTIGKCSFVIIFLLVITSLNCLW